jgi:hypothetical protein
VAEKARFELDRQAFASATRQSNRAKYEDIGMMAILGRLKGHPILKTSFFPMRAVHFGLDD